MNRETERRHWRAMKVLLRRVCIGLFCLGIAYSPSIADPINLVQNGDFATGDFTGWTLFTTPNGSLGFAPVPDVVSFDVTSSGATNAARFQVGQIDPAIIPRPVPAGGRLEQNVLTGTGTFMFTANIAAFFSPPFDCPPSSCRNSDAGTFSAFLDGVTLATTSFGD